MEIQQLDVLFRLVIAHLLADFVFQTDKIVKGKQKGIKSRYFFLHIIIVGVLTYLCLGHWNNWWAPLSIMLIHGAIDWGKIKLKTDNTWVYLGDQLLHLLTLIIFWHLIVENGLLAIIQSATALLSNPKILVVITAYLVATIPTGILIGYLTGNWQKQLKEDAKDKSSKKKNSLRKAGQWIGILERLLVLTFILLGELRAIGFLLAAKSVFRFGDLNGKQDRKKTEYILIGTLLSFTFSILIGIFTSYLISTLD
ncbi:MAG: DUF3307 domain-containing protein [Bacteroidota bacterium]